MPVKRGANDQDSPPAELLERPAYSLAMASRLVGLTKPRVSRWLRGYTYKYASHPGEKVIRRSLAPVIPPKHSDDRPYVSFLDVVDLLFVKTFLERGTSLQRRVRVTRLP